MSLQIYASLFAFSCESDPEETTGSATRMRRLLASPVKPSPRASTTSRYELDSRITARMSTEHSLRDQMKVGADVGMDQRRMALIRSIIDDPKECAARPAPSPESLVGKQAGPTGSVLMIDSNQVWE